jgi:CubicO group peptidase (beta-lactamase class C family)
MNIQGFVKSGYEGVRDAFQDNFDNGGDLGAACCVYVNGKVAVDLWGGVADSATGRAWERDTPVLLASSTKGLTAICMHRPVQRGELDLDAPIAHYWPEFAAEGKGSIPVQWALSHRAGVPAVDRRFTIEDVLNWHPVVAAVAAQKPE